MRRAALGGPAEKLQYVYAKGLAADSSIRSQWRMGHAGAIVMGNRETYAAKKDALEGAGVAVLPTPGDIGTVLRKRMG